MSSGGFGSRDLSETFQEVLTGCAKVVMSLGGLATLISVGLLVFTCVRVSGDSVSAAQLADAARNIDLFKNVLVVGVLGLVVGSTVMFWGAELLGVGQLFGAAALYFAPLYLPSVIGDKSNDATQHAYSALQLGGTVLGVLGLLVVVVDVAIRIQQRMKVGVKADQIKLGKGVKEEGDKQNVLLGKCWQLPFCRKFVRESCPIYLSKRTCWKEMVGCMCEESVIRTAMEGKTISKEQLLTGNFIPQNNRLTIAQKKERCYSCIIFNEHQKHKYRVAMPSTVLTWLLIYGLFHGLLIDAVSGLVGKINHIVNIGTLGAAGNYKPPEMFVEAMLAVFMVILLTYAMKVLEFVCFKIKV